MIHKNKDNELWCDCGNKEHLIGFLLVEDEVECLKCKETINIEEVELRTEPEERV